MHCSTVVRLGPSRRDVVRSVQGSEEIENVIGDFFATMATVVCFIIMRVDFVSPSSIQCRCMKKICIYISLLQLSDFRFDFPKILSTGQERVIFTEELLFQILKEATMTVVDSFLDSIKSS